jgi:hypothetical protein
MGTQTAGNFLMEIPRTIDAFNALTNKEHILKELWWLNGSMPNYCSAIPGSNLASSQPTADCPSPGGLPPGMAIG